MEQVDKAEDYLSKAGSVDPLTSPVKLSLWFQSTHKGQTTACCFSSDGLLAATGSSDTSLKVIDVERVKLRNNSNSEDSKPVIRTYYDHQASVNEVCFHPNGLILASASDDGTIKLFDIGKGAHAKRGFRGIVDAYPVKSISFHPSGDFLLSGTTMPSVRIHDIRTNQSYRLKQQADDEVLPFDEKRALTKVCFDSTGRLFASGSAGGSITIYDGVSGRPVRKIAPPNGQAAVTSLHFAKNSKNLLSASANGSAHLWDLSLGKPTVTYPGLSAGKYNPVAFSNDEKIVYGAETGSSTVNQSFSAGVSTNIVQFSSISGKALNGCFAHNGPICTISSHPSESAVFTGGADRWAKYWAPAESR